MEKTIHKMNRRDKTLSNKIKRARQSRSEIALQQSAVLNDRRSVERCYYVIGRIGGWRRGYSVGLPVCHHVRVEYGNQCQRWCANIVRVQYAIITGSIDVARIGIIWAIMTLHIVNMAKICGRVSMKFDLQKSGCNHGQ